MSVMTKEITNTDDLIDVRDVIARFEELEADYEAAKEKANEKLEPVESHWSAEQEAELQSLTKLLEEVKGSGGDEEWRGDWYPITLIRESYFEDYTQDLMADCGDLPSDLPWYIAIDWAKTAKNILVDYTSAEFDGVTYYTR